MGVRNAGRLYPPVIAVGVVVAVACSVLGFFRSFLPGDQRLHGMPLSSMPEMFLGGGGIVLALAGALLRGRVPEAAEAAGRPPRHRWLVAGVATVALTIDVSKTSTLGFVMPGMRAEYGLDPTTGSMLAVGGLSGTAIGAVLVGRLAERIGRRTCYLLATLGFTATSMCATMPTFGGNVVMCFLMGVAVGGLAPLLVTILTDLFPGRTRGPMVTGLSVVATALGYLVASGSALWLEPTYGWRVLWLIGAPTGLLLALVTLLVPERVRAAAPPAPRLVARKAFTARLQWLYAGTIGLLTFGLTTWVPTLARSADLSLTSANTLLTLVAVAMVPCAVLIAAGYRRIGPIPLAVLLGLCTAGLLLVLTLSGLASVSWLSAAVLAAALFAVNTMAAVFLPIAADLADSPARDRTTGTVSFFNRIGGLTGPLVLSLVVSSVTDILLAVAVLALLCGGIAWFTGTRHRTVGAGALPETGDVVRAGGRPDID